MGYYVVKNKERTFPSINANVKNKIKPSELLSNSVTKKEAIEILARNIQKYPNAVICSDIALLLGVEP